MSHLAILQRIFLWFAGAGLLASGSAWAGSSHFGVYLDLGDFATVYKVHDDRRYYHHGHNKHNHHPKHCNHYSHGKYKHKYYGHKYSDHKYSGHKYYNHNYRGHDQRSYKRSHGYHSKPHHYDRRRDYRHDHRTIRSKRGVSFGQSANNTGREHRTEPRRYVREDRKNLRRDAIKRDRSDGSRSTRRIH